MRTLELGRTLHGRQFEIARVNVGTVEDVRYHDPGVSNAPERRIARWEHVAQITCFRPIEINIDEAIVDHQSRVVTVYFI